MRRILICSGVLGGGTALVLGAAALTAVLIPPGRIVPQNQNVVVGGSMPVMVAPAVLFDDGGGWAGGPAPVELPTQEPAP